LPEANNLVSMLAAGIPHLLAIAPDYVMLIFEQLGLHQAIFPIIIGILL